MDTHLSFKGKNPGAVRYGNYINYYQFHPPETRIESLLAIPSDVWKIQDKKHCLALDIGCNAGDLTKNLYYFYLDKKVGEHIIVLGIDIDPKLIERANENNENGNLHFQCLDIMRAETKDILTTFLQGHGKTKFDIISCFSTTMWIHLNNGDDGLCNFLKLLCELGHLLIVEPQPWSRYREAVRRLKKESDTFPMYQQLKIRSNVESEIENIVVQENFDKIHETTSVVWLRKVFFFYNKR